MKKTALRIAAITGIVLLILCLSAFIASLLFSGKIRTMAVSELNKQLNTEVKVNGPIEFSLLAHFPFCSISFDSVIIKETLPEKNDLLKCSNVSLLFSIWNLFRSSYVVQKVIAENGVINIRIDSSGNSNYNIFRSGNTGNDFSLKLKQAVLNNMLILYSDNKNEQHYSILADGVTMAGDFSASHFSLSVHGDAFSNYFLSGDIDFFPKRNLNLQCNIDVDLNRQLYTFHNSAFSVNRNMFHVDGNIASVAEGKNIQLKIASGKLRLEEIITLLPPEFTRRLSQFTSSGNLSFTGEISGVQSASSSPTLNASFHLNDVTISNPKVKQVCQHLNADATFTNGNQQNSASSSLEISRFSCTIDGDNFSGTFGMKNFSRPFLDIVLNGNIQLAKIYPLLSDSSVKSLNGIVTLHDCFFHGALAQLSSPATISKINAGGKFDLHNVRIVTSKTDYENLNGTFDIRNNDITFSNCFFKARQSDLKLEGTVSNLFPFLYSALNDSLNIKQKVGLNVQIASRQMRWEDLVGNPSASSAVNDDYSIPEIFYWLTGSLSGTVDVFSYERFNATGIHGNFVFLPDNIYFDNIGFEAEKGMVTASGKLNISNPLHSRLELTSKLDHLDITQLFYELNDFNQSTLTHNNLKGRVTANISLQSAWDNNRLNKQKLHALADVSVEDGELNNFEPMLALSTFLKLKELQHISFSRMQNQLEIRDEKVLIPAMQIFSSALNVQLSGSHGFDNIIDYKLQLNLLRLLTDKFRKQKPKNDGEQTTEGFLNLYLTMQGPAANPTISYDKKAVKEKIATDLAAEKSNLKDALSKEFNEQSASQHQAKDYKPADDVKYFEFEDSTDNEKSGSSAKRPVSTTKEHQKQAASDFKNIFKKPPKQQ